MAATLPTGNRQRALQAGPKCTQHRSGDGSKRGSVAPTTEWSRRCANSPGPGQTRQGGPDMPHGTSVVPALPSSTPRQPSPTPLTRGFTVTAPLFSAAIHRRPRKTQASSPFDPQGTASTIPTGVDR